MVKPNSQSSTKKSNKPPMIWRVLANIMGPVLKKRLNFHCDDFDFGTIEGPVIVIPNHACSWDPICVGYVFKNKTLAFVASEHILRTKWGKILGRHIDIIPFNKGAENRKSVAAILRILKEGGSVFLAAEGEQTWDGITCKVIETTGKIIKKSGATLITYKLEGAYLAVPRWARNPRKGLVYGHMVNIYSPEQLNEMTAREINETINRDLAFNVWEWQKSSEKAGREQFEPNQSGGLKQASAPIEYISGKGGLAEGLETFLYMCPSCGKIGGLRSAGDELSCTCGYKVKYLKTGFLERQFELGEAGEGTDFGTVKDWSHWEDERLAKLLACATPSEEPKVISGVEEVQDDAATDLVTDFMSVEYKLANCTTENFKSVNFKDEGVTIVRIGDNHEETESHFGQLEFNGKTIKMGEYSFEIKDIGKMTMILNNRLVFNVDGDYYEVRTNGGNEGNQAVNLRKYMVVWQVLRDHTN